MRIQQVQGLQSNMSPCIEGSLQLMGTLHDQELRGKIAFYCFDDSIASYPPVVKGDAVGTDIFTAAQDGVHCLILVRLVSSFIRGRFFREMGRKPHPLIPLLIMVTPRVSKQRAFVAEFLTTPDR